MSEPEIILPDGWPRPRGYAHAIAATGKIIALAGQIGWNPRTQQFETSDFVQQVRVALENVVTVLGAAGATVADVVRMTWFITDREIYVQNATDIGEVYREMCGRHYPPMSVVVVAALIEPEAKVEIEATAVIPL